MEEKKILYTKDPYKELLIFASENKCKVDELDFRLLSFSTSYTYDNQEWIKVNEKELKIFEEDEKFLIHDLNIEQEYKIEIYFKKIARSSAFEVSLHTNELCTLLKASVKASEIIAFHDKLALELLEAIYKAMIKEKYLLGFRILILKSKLLILIPKPKKSKNLILKLNLKFVRELIHKSLQMKKFNITI